jgi:hypothetical protein
MSIDLNAPEVQEAIKTAVKEATEGLVRKRDELLAELKEARKGKAIDPEELEKRDQRIEELEAKLKEAEKTVKKATADAEAAKKALADEAGFSQRLLVDNGLNEALAKAGVTNPVHLKAARAMLAGQVQVVAEGDQRVVKIGDKPAADFIAEWAKGDEGKFFVSAAQNSGGGATGSGGGAPASKKVSQMTPDEKGAFIAQHGIEKWQEKVRTDYAPAP